MLSLTWLLAALFLSLRPSYVSAQNENSSAAAINFSKAVVQEASVSAQLQLANTSNPIPLPAKNPGNIPNYNSLLAMAGAWPPLPVAMGEVDVGQVVANMTPPSHAETSDADSSNNNRRQGGALRVLVVGDSMTHGSEGDYTWRYRMHEWFTSQGILYQFVGPYAGTIKPPEPTPPEKPLLYNAVALNPPPNVGGGYAAGAGGTPLPHFAVSGRAAATNQNLIQNVVASYPADLMLINLGFNDLGWFYSDDNGLVNSMRNLINNARRANPNMKFVVATVVHRTFIGGRPDLVAMTDHYNSMLKQAVGGWSTPSSPVVWAPVREEYNCGPSYSEQCPASYDGLHPNELGEYQIARGFTRGLVSGLGIGKAPLEVPGNIPTRLLPVPSNFQIATSDLGATATWDKVYGAYEYDVDYNINGGAPFNFSPGSVKSNRWDTRWAGNGWTYQVRVRASAGNRKGGWTRWLMATARPKTASAGTEMNVKTHATADGIDITWDAATGPYSDSISQYNIYYWDRDEPCAFLLVGGFQPGGRASLTGLVPGHRYLIAVETWNSVGAGFPFVARQAVPGRGAPVPVSGLRVYETDPTTSHITWDAVPGAAGYYLWNRNVNNASSSLEPLALGGEAAEPCWDVAFLFPGTWNYEWAVTAFNGDQDSARSAVTAPPAQGSGSGGGGGGTCPAPPAWCPPGAYPGPPPTEPVDNSNPPPASGGGGGGGQGPGAPTCDTATDTDCTPCSGNGCDGCKDEYESQCAGCSGLGCAGQSFPCQGTSCSVCSGSGCAGCHGSDCETCKGSACGNTRNPCSGPLCSLCTGSSCDGCLAADCEVCTGADCGPPDARGCQGPLCSLCIGSGCSSGECVGSDCPKVGGCQGSGCGTDGGCQGQGGDGDACCRGPGCGSDGKCVGPFCVSGGCSGVGCSNGRCTSLDCCSGPGCSEGTCVGPHCYQGGCSGPDCGGGGTVCTGPFCCFGIDCLQGTCIGPACVGGGEQNEIDDCGEPATASVCTETVTSFIPWAATTTTTATRTHCDKITACKARGATRTTTLLPCQCTACAAEPDSNYELDFGDNGMTVRYPYPSDLTIVGPDDQTIWPTGGSAGSPPTTASPQPTPTPTSQPPSQPTSPPAPKNRLWIFQDMTPTEFTLFYSWWFVWRPLDGSSWSVCDEPNDYLCQDDGKDQGCDKSGDPDEDGNPGFPGGDFTMTRNEAKGCTYKGTKAGPGTLNCPGFSKPVQCGDAGTFGNENIPCPGASFNDAVYCDY